MFTSIRQYCHYYSALLWWPLEPTVHLTNSWFENARTVEAFWNPRFLSFFGRPIRAGGIPAYLHNAFHDHSLLLCVCFGIIEQRHSKLLSRFCNQKRSTEVPYPTTGHLTVGLTGFTQSAHHGKDMITKTCDNCIQPKCGINSPLNCPH